MQEHIEDFNVSEVLEPNRDVVKIFKTMQKNKTNFMVMVKDGSIAAINDKHVLVYNNPKEIDFEGTFRIARSKLIPLEYSLSTNPNTFLDLKKFELVKRLDTKATHIQKLCYEQSLCVNFYSLAETFEALFDRYHTVDIYKSVHDSVAFVFSAYSEKTVLLTKTL